MSPRIYLTADWHLRDNATHDAPVADCVRQLATHRQPDDVLVVAGDLTDGGTEAEYRRALELLLPWRGRCLLAPGNHDFGYLGLLVGMAARGRWAKLLRSLQAGPQLQVGRTLLVALDSCLYSALPTDLARGRLGARQSRRAREGCAEARRRALRPVIVMHHWPWCTDPTLLLEDGRDVQHLAAVELAGGVGRQGGLLVAGHTHQAAERSGPGWRAVCLSALGAAGRAEVIES